MHSCTASSPHPIGRVWRAKDQTPGSYRQPEFIDSAVPFATGSSPTSAPCRLVFVQSLDLHPTPVALLGSPDFQGTVSVPVNPLSAAGVGPPGWLGLTLLHGDSGIGI